MDACVRAWECASMCLNSVKLLVSAVAHKKLLVVSLNLVGLLYTMSYKYYSTINVSSL